MKKRPLMKMSALAGAVLLALAGCGSTSDEEPAETKTHAAVTVEPDGTQVIDLRETDEYRFVPDDPHVQPGKIRIDFTNTSATNTHSFAFKPGGPAEEIPFINPGEKKSLSFKIDTPGEYKFFCTFHESLGQRGTLTVEQP